MTRRRIVAPWIIVASVTVLVLAVMGTGYAYLIRKPCSGQVTATVVVSPLLSKTLDGLNRNWQGTQPSVNGTCVAVNIVEKDSATMARALGAPWDPKSGPAPDVWVPESTAWVRLASNNGDAERMMPDLQPSLARSPVVLAMPKDMAQAMHWPKIDLAWSQFADNKIDWSQYGHPWGPFRLGMADPNVSTASMLALIDMLDASGDGEISRDEQQSLFQIKNVMKDYRPGTDTADLLGTMAKADATGKDAVFRYLSGFPALEQDVLAYNHNNPAEPLVAVYPKDGSDDADNPYLILDSTWATPARKKAAGKFLQYLRGPEGRSAFLSEDLRDPNRVGGPDMTQDNGVEPTVPTLPRSVLLPESVKATVDTWTGVTRPTNLLLVLDVSGSMNIQVPGTGKSRLQLAKDAALSAVNTFGDDARVGLWVFSSNLAAGNKDYREVVRLGPLNEQMNDGDTRRQHLINGIHGLQASGNTGLYDTAVAAQKNVLANYQSGSTNMVVLITDGTNDDPNGGLNLDQAKAQLIKDNADPNRLVPVITVGYGADVDVNALRTLGDSSGGHFLPAKQSFNINEVLFTAIFGPAA